MKIIDERLITPSGLSLVGAALRKSQPVNRANHMPVEKKRSQPQIKNVDILLTYPRLLCQGKTEYEAVREMKEDPDYCKTVLGIAYAIPSAKNSPPEDG